MSTAAPPSLPLAASTPTVKPDLRLVVALAAVWVIWGSTYLAMRVAVEELPPFLMGATRFVLAGSVLLGFVRARGGALPSRRDWLAAVPIGALLFLVGNGFVVVAEQKLPSSVAAVVCATTPLVAAGLGAGLGRFAPGGRQRPRRIEVIGMLFGIVGVALLGVGSPLAGAGVRGLLVLLAPVGWAIGSLVARARETKASPIASAGAQMFMGGLWMFAAAFVLGEHAPSTIGWRSGAAWGYLVVCGSVVGFSAYSWLLRHARPAVAMSYAYVNPIIAVLLGAALGGETLGWATLAATVLIAAGIVATVVIGRRQKA
ncbi:MAG: EamA family transporter [Deltaproteobacteria bacterium]|nr:EamA family transporter [Deltaproteobacteria bacterium]